MITMKGVIALFSTSIKILCITFLIFSLAACAGLRKNLVSLSEEDLANAEASRTIAKNLLLTWGLNSGFIRGAMGDRLNELPAAAVKALDELDALAEATEWTDFDLGYSLGLRVRLLSDLVLNALKSFAPEVLKYLPLAF